MLPDNRDGTRCIRSQLERHAAQHRVFKIRYSRGAYHHEVVVPDFSLVQQFVSWGAFLNAHFRGKESDDSSCSRASSMICSASNRSSSPNSFSASGSSGASAYERSSSSIPFLLQAKPEPGLFDDMHQRDLCTSEIEIR